MTAVLSFEADGTTSKFFVTRREVRLWDYTTGKALATMGKPVDIRSTVTKGGYRPPKSVLEDIGAGVPGFGVRLSPATGRVMIFPSFKNPLEAIVVAKGSIGLVDRLTGKELHRFSDFADGYLGAFALSEDGTKLTAMGSIAHKPCLLVWDLSRWREEALRVSSEVSGDEPKQLWDKLGDDDPREAYRAMRRLAAAHEKTIPFLGARIKAVVAGKIPVAKLLEQLNDGKFSVREKAEVALLAAGDAAIPLLQKALQAPPSAEARQRMEKIRAQLEDGLLSDPATRRLLWCIKLLEEIGSTEAKELLSLLAQGDASAWIRQEAKAALERAEKAMKGVQGHPGGCLRCSPVTPCDQIA